MASVPVVRLTEEQYLEIERQAETKSEFHDGEMFAMACGTRNHAKLGSRVNALFDTRVPEECSVVGSDMRIRIAATGQQTYADCAVVCGQDEPEEVEDIIENPILIVEVLSPSTEAYDRGKKFEAYQTIPSLRDYLLVHQDRRRVEHFTKLDDGSWNLRICAGQEGSIVIPRLGVTIGMGELYRKIKGLR